MGQRDVRGKPSLKEWEILWDTNPEIRVQLQNSYQATCSLYPDGTIGFKSDPEGSLRVKPAKLRAMLEEAHAVARHYYGEAWGA